LYIDSITAASKGITYGKLVGEAGVVAENVEAESVSFKIKETL